MQSNYRSLSSLREVYNKNRIAPEPSTPKPPAPDPPPPADPIKNPVSTLNIIKPATTSLSTVTTEVAIGTTQIESAAHDGLKKAATYAKVDPGAESRPRTPIPIKESDTRDLKRPNSFSMESSSSPVHRTRRADTGGHGKRSSWWFGRSVPSEDMDRMGEGVSKSAPVSPEMPQNELRIEEQMDSAVMEPAVVEPEPELVVEEPTSPVEERKNSLSRQDKRASWWMLLSNQTQVASIVASQAAAVLREELPVSAITTVRTIEAAPPEQPAAEPVTQTQNQSASWWPFTDATPAVTETIPEQPELEQEAIKGDSTVEAQPPPAQTYSEYMWSWVVTPSPKRPPLDAATATEPPAAEAQPEPPSSVATRTNSIPTTANASYWQYFFSARGQQVLQQSTVASDKLITASEAPPPPSESTEVPVYVNQVLPTFEPESVKQEEPSSRLYSTLSAVGSLFFSRPAKPATLPSVNKVVIIGVHGWFPTKFVQKVFGEPTGTSEKFCEMMSRALSDYVKATYGIEMQEDNVTLFPLQGEGKVTDRVAKLHKKLLPTDDLPTLEQRLQSIEQADVVIVSTHSQGTPVSTMLLARLIEEGVVRPSKQRVGMLAMAGITHGPFPYLKGNVIVKYFEAEAARELFDFMDPASEPAIRYRNAMHTILVNGVRLLCVASMADQVVPLYSATMHGFTHPNILRAVYIDGHDYKPDFLTHLIVFLLKLRNHGVPDHGLAVHLSEAVAGSLYHGTQGHSTIYEDLGVYALSIRWILGAPSTPVPHPVLPTLSETFHADTRLNPYYLPWILRGLLDDEKLAKNIELQNDVKQLQIKFEEWEPASRPLKDLKLRLEPIRARF